MTLQSVALSDVKQDFKRASPGLSRKMRSIKYPELFCFFDPDRLRSPEKPPDHVQLALEEVMGAERMRDLKLRPHPILTGYWCLCERVRHPKLGENLWHIVSIFHDGERDGYLPEHLERMGLENLRGLIGNPRQPTKKDFELIEPTDKKRYGAKEVENRFAAHEDAIEHEKDRVFADRAEDFLDYHFWLAMRDAQAHYSRPWSVPKVELKDNPERWVNLPQLNANGEVSWWLRMRRGSQAHRSYVEAKLQARRERQDARGLEKRKTNFVPEILEPFIETPRAEPEVRRIPERVKVPA